MLKKIKREDIIVILISAIIIFGIVISTKSLFSGYHLVDDNYAYIYKKDFQNKNLLSTIIYWVKSDLAWRFRPLYKVEQVCLAAIFGTNLNLWMFLTALKGVISSLFLWKFARICSLNHYFSGLFVGVCLLGDQFGVWIRQGNQENTGMMLLSITLYMLAKEAKMQVRNDNSGRLPLFLGFFIFLTSIEKESFIIMIPAYILLSMTFAMDVDIVDDEKQGNYIENILIEKLKNVWRRRWKQYITWLVIMGIELIVIVFFIGTNENGYAGFSRDTGLGEYISGISKSILHYCKGLTCLVICFVIYILLYANNLWKEYIGYCLSGIFIIISQLLLHAKSGMWERYKIPCTVGVAILAVMVFGKIAERTKNNLQQWPQWIYLSCLILLLAFGVKDSVDYARAWTASTAEGEEGICTALYSLTEENEEIVLLSNDSEHSNCITAWMVARKRNVMKYTYNDIADCNKYRIAVIEGHIDDEEELLKTINWDGCREVYKNNGFVIWLQEN